MSSIKSPLPKRVKIELPSGILAQLISSGMLYGRDCKCLDDDAKQVVWQSLLASSTQEGV